MDRAITLLKAVAEVGGDRRITGLARRCDLNRATAWRLLMTLEAHGMVLRESGTGRFLIGPAVADLVAEVGGSLAEIVQPVLERLSLETGEIVSLGVVDSDEVRYAAEVIPPNVRSRSWLGESAVLHATSAGKVFLAHLEDGRVASLVGEHPHTYTDTTLTDPAALRTELRRVRDRGFSVCQGEFAAGSWGVAAPVLGSQGEPLATLCLWGPDRRGDHARLEALGRVAVNAVRELRAAGICQVLALDATACPVE